MNELIFVSAQPDQTYFHWQVELYMYQFAKHGIQDRCYALFGYRGTPSAAAVALSKKYKGIRFYNDSRNYDAPNYYIPSIRPHLLKQFFEENPALGKHVFYHDADIFLVRMPKVELMLTDTTGYVSDTISYIGYKYIKECADRYKAVYPALEDEDIFIKMCAVANIDPEIVRQNDAHSGGAQYVLKGLDAQFWTEVEIVANELYRMLSEYERSYPIPHHIQKWTADMWAVLWIYWKRGNQTRIHSELDFSWATGTVQDYHEKPIFHLAGVTDEDKRTHFFKGEYIHKDVFAEYRRNKTIFDYISPNSATTEYVKVIKEYVDGKVDEPPNESKVSKGSKGSKGSRFLIKVAESWAGVYKVEETKVCDRPIWRSADGNYIMFHNRTSWIVTASVYLNEVGEGAGGFACNGSAEPYETGWNKECKITVL